MQAVLDYFNLDVSNPVTGASHPRSPRCHAMPNSDAAMDLPAAFGYRSCASTIRIDLVPGRNAVMTQEMCKDFLAGSSNREAAARQRYKLYTKATLLEQSDEGLTRARHNVHETHERLQVRAGEARIIIGHGVDSLLGVPGRRFSPTRDRLAVI